jgi:hypothetical protein
MNIILTSVQDDIYTNSTTVNSKLGNGVDSEEYENGSFCAISVKKSVPLTLLITRKNE